MKKLITTLLLIVGVCGFAKAEKIRNLLVASDTVIWTGLDYSLASVIGRAGANSTFAFAKEQTNFPAVYEKWNNLFLDERVNAVASALGKKIEVDINGVMDSNRKTFNSQLKFSTHISEETTAPNIPLIEIVNQVRSYKMDHTNGLGLVLIIDKLIEGSFYGHASKPSFGAVYVVFFDVATREVISAEREVYTIQSAANFRNFWFGPIKDADSSLIKFQPAKKPLVPITPRSR